MERIRHIEHQGRQIVLLDFSGLTAASDWEVEVAKARALVASHPPDNSLLTLTDVTDVGYDKRIVQLFKQLSDQNKPYVKAAAVVANSSLNRSVISLVAMLTKRSVHAFDRREEALEWLVQQG
jgi:hypothetical protein